MPVLEAKDFAEILEIEENLVTKAFSRREGGGYLSIAF